MKRSPDESFVFTPSKQPRQGPSAGPQSISELARNIPDKRIKAMHAYLQVWVETPDDDIDFASVHGIVQLSLPTRTPPRFVDLTTFEKNIEGQKGQFYDVMRSASRKPLCREELEKLITYDAFWSLPSKSNFAVEDMTMVSPRSQNKVIQESWNADFIDHSPLRGLEQHITEQLDLEAPYGRFCAIVQSSGMGKSRLLDELSKNYFLIPINLRSPNAKGYPPPDDDLRNFLTACSIKVPVDGKNDEFTEFKDPECRVGYFLVELFKKTAEMVKVEGMGNDKASRIRKFREFMSKDQSMDSAGAGRLMFYQDVIRRANKSIQESGDKPPDREQLSGALEVLRQALNANSIDQSCSISSTTGTSPKNTFADVFVAFDEAHTLAETFDKPNESRFVVLRRKLSVLSSKPLFSFFLSTTGKITQFGQPRGNDPSNRISRGILSTPRPYIYLGFDQLMQSRRVFERCKTLEEVTSLDCAAHMGRPLWGTRFDHGDALVRQNLVEFAKEKLLCADTRSKSFSPAQMYAVLSQRLALDANTPQYLFHCASPFDSMQVMHEQIANHMRVCVAIGDGIESVRAIAPSEPILSEAASRIMASNDFSLSSALSTVLKGYCINQGDRGELLAASFFAWARDKVVKRKGDSDGMLCPIFSVADLFGDLLSETTYQSILDHKPSLCDPKSMPLLFRDAFGRTKMHFNHVLKPQEQKIITRSYLLQTMARGAAALGANCQPGFDAVYPYLYGSSNLETQNLGFIIVQVKNNRNSSRSINEIFQKMDPFYCGLINDSDKVDGRFPIPIIRLVFLLAEDEPDFTQWTYKSPSQGAKPLEDEDGKPVKGWKPLFTSYDYVCRGVSPMFLRPTHDSHDAWKALVNAWDGWGSFYDVVAPGVLRSQLPAHGGHTEHFSSWSGYK